MSQFKNLVFKQTFGERACIKSLVTSLMKFFVFLMLKNLFTLN